VLELADLVDGVPQVGVVHLGMGRLDLVKVLAGIVQGQQRRGLQAALLGGGRLGAGSIAARGVLALGPQLVP